MDPILRLSSVSKSFGGVRALKSVDFDVRRGEVHALLGENGAGKSTLIKIITGAVSADAGEIWIEGQRVEQNDPILSARLGVAVIYQQPALFAELSVAENIDLRLGASAGGAWINWRQRFRQARRLLEQVGADIHPSTPAGRLSMPQQQLVEIAAALGAEARIMIFDEPTASLSEREVENLFRVIVDLKSRQVGIVYISHRLEELPRIADRVTVLRDGVHVATRSTPTSDRSELIRLMVGRSLEAVYPKLEVPLGPKVVEAEEISSREAGITGVSFSVRAGEIVGLSGLVGAGRTELARTLFGITPADRGQLRLRDRVLRFASARDAVAAGIAYLPEDRRQHGVVLEMPIVQNLSLAILGQLSSFGLLRRREERSLAQGFVQSLAIKAASIDVPAATLSGGNQQKVALSRWLATKPEVLILDEPTQGVDVGAKAEIHRLMGELARSGMAILMISSELPEILGMSDRILVMRNGRIAGEVRRSEATQEKLLELALGRDDAGAGSSPSSSRSWGRAGEGAARIKLARSSIFAAHRRELSVFSANLLLFLLLAAFHPDFFHQQAWLTAVSAAPMLLLASAMTLVILARQIDISIGSQFSVCGVVAAALAGLGVPLPLVALGTILLGAGLGAINGWLVAGLGLPSIVATLASMVVLRGALLWATQGAATRFPPGFQWFGLSQSAGQAALVGLTLALFALLLIGSRWLRPLRSIRAVGCDAESARLAGIRPRLVVFNVFVLMGAMTGLAALLSALELPLVYPNAGEGLELAVIAAAIVGGTAISGGRGTLLGTLLGVILLATIGPAMIFFHTPPQWARAVQGVAILLAVASDALDRRGR